MFELFSTLKWNKKMPSIKSKILAYFTRPTLHQSRQLNVDIASPNDFPTNYQNFNTAILKANLNKTLTFHYYHRPILK